MEKGSLFKTFHLTVCIASEMILTVLRWDESSKAIFLDVSKRLEGQPGKRTSGESSRRPTIQSIHSQRAGTVTMNHSSPDPVMEYGDECPTLEVKEGLPQRPKVD